MAESSKPEKESDTEGGNERVERRSGRDRRVSTYDRRGDDRVADAKPRRQTPDRRRET